MRRYDDPVEVRKGWVGGPETGVEGPEQFLWRGRLWKVRDVIAHWVETGPWWQSSGARALLGSDEGGSETRAPLGADLLGERELWRVEAGRGRAARFPEAVEPADGVSGVFDLAFDWNAGSWQLIGCVD